MIMAQILALDTSTDACSVALQTHEQTFERFEVVPRKHTQLLLPMVQSLLDEAQVSVADLDMIAFGRGPGSFAGIRIATGAAQGLALAYETPVAAISTLEAMAYRALELNPDAEYILAALDARMDELYWCCYRVETGNLCALQEERVGAPETLGLPCDGRWLFAGSGASYLSRMPEIEAKIASVDAEIYPEARIMLQLAQREYTAGRLLKPEEAQPVYLREGSWKKKDQQ